MLGTVCRNGVRPGGAIVPLAVSNGKMPVAAPKAAVKQKRRKGPDLRLCKRFQETGNCTDPNCSLAHGAEDLEQRQMAARSVLLSQLSQPTSIVRKTCVMLETALAHCANSNAASACNNVGSLDFAIPLVRVCYIRYSVQRGEKGSSNGFQCRYCACSKTLLCRGPGCNQTVRPLLPCNDAGFSMLTNELLKGATLESAAVSDLREPIILCKQGMVTAAGC